MKAIWRMVAVWVAVLAMVLAGPVRAGVDFDGTDDLLSAGNPGLSGTNHTICAWVYLDNASGGRTCVSYRSTSSTTPVAALLDWTGTAWRAIVRSDGNVLAQATASDSSPTGRWIHLATTREGNTVRIYTNGVQGGTATAGSTIGTTITVNALSIGAMNAGSATPSLYFDGKISDVQIYDRALSAGELSIVASSRTKGPKFSGLIYYWPLDDQPDGTSGDGDTFVDRAGTANATGNDGANNTGLTARAEDFLSYP